ncbi:MAG: hypothetical protein U1F67_07700 [Rubrivivax sp.]
MSRAGCCAAAHRRGAAERCGQQRVEVVEQPLVEAMAALAQFRQRLRSHLVLRETAAHALAAGLVVARQCTAHQHAPARAAGSSLPRMRRSSYWRRPTAANMHGSEVSMSVPRLVTSEAHQRQLHGSGVVCRA